MDRVDSFQLFKQNSTQSNICEKLTTMQIQIDHGNSSSGTVVGLNGKLDSGNALPVEIALLEVIAKGETNLKIDCKQLTFVSSAGLRSLIMAIKKMKPLGGTVTLLGLQSNVKEVLEISGLLPLFKIQDI